jgi:glucose-1-phosphate adenylyltransferase
VAKDLIIILAGGAGQRLLLLSEHRAKPAVPFGGIYRIIDFTLSNCVNSGLYQIVILSQYRPRSLWSHLEFGQPWNLDRTNGGMVILQPYIGGPESKWYEGNADAVYQNLPLIHEKAPDAVVILAGDHIYKMDYRPLIDFHRQKEADLTVALKRVKEHQTSEFGTCRLNSDRRIIEFEEKADTAKSNLASMGIYVFRRRTLVDCLLKDAQNISSSHDFGKDIVPWLVESGRIFGYEYAGYWQDVGTVNTYFEANMDLLAPDPPIKLDDPDWPIFTNCPDLPPASALDSSLVSQSLICDGSSIDGTVETSVVSPEVIVEDGAVVRNSILLAGSVVSRGAKVNLCIIDKHSFIGEKARVGYGVDFSPNERYPNIMNRGITLIGKGSYIPKTSVIGRNCVIRVADPAGAPLEVPSGTSLL